MADLKIALCGSAPSSSRSAPYGDPSWSIWGCSPGLYGVATRVDMWFETHLWEPGQAWFSPEYVQWLKALPGRGVTLFTGAPDPESPVYQPSPVEGGKVLPWKELLAEFDPSQFFCTSSLFWMMALAITLKPSKIGLWGIDMAATEEYEMQRAGLHFLTYEARRRGIEVGVPMESDLFTPRFRYGIDEWTHGYRKMRTRRFELEQRLAQAEAQQKESERSAYFMKGALDDSKYMSDTWTDRKTYTAPVGFPGDLSALESTVDKPKRKAT